MDWQTFTTNWGFNYAFAASLVITIALALWTYTTLPRTRLKYFIRNSTVINETSPAYSSSIKISFEGTEIPRATLSQVYVWNGGNQTIRRADIAPKSPLILFVPVDQIILHIAVDSMAEPSMDVFLERDKIASTDLSFEYIEPNQGFVCSILHTGTPHDLDLKGVVVSAGKPRFTPLPSEELSNRGFLVVMLLGVPTPLIVTELMRDYFNGPFWFIISMILLLTGTVCWVFLLLDIAMRRGRRKIDFGKPRE